MKKAVIATVLICLFTGSALANDDANDEVKYVYQNKNTCNTTQPTNISGVYAILVPGSHSHTGAFLTVIQGDSVRATVRNFNHEDNTKGVTLNEQRDIDENGNVTGGYDTVPYSGSKPSNDITDTRDPNRGRFEQIGVHYLMGRVNADGSHDSWQSTGPVSGLGGRNPITPYTRVPSDETNNARGTYLGTELEPIPEYSENTENIFVSFVDSATPYVLNIFVDPANTANNEMGLHKYADFEGHKVFGFNESPNCSVRREAVEVQL